jgi:hypothetical protein
MRFAFGRQTNAAFNHTRGANAPLAPSPVFQLSPPSRGVSHPTPRTVLIGNQPEWDSHKLGLHMRTGGTNLHGILPNDSRYALLESGRTVKIFFMP